MTALLGRVDPREGRPRDPRFLLTAPVHEAFCGSFGRGLQPQRGFQGDRCHRQGSIPCPDGVGLARRLASALPHPHFYSVRHQLRQPLCHFSPDPKDVREQ